MEILRNVFNILSTLSEDSAPIVIIIALGKMVYDSIKLYIDYRMNKESRELDLDVKKEKLREDKIRFEKEMDLKEIEIEERRQKLSSSHDVEEAHHDHYDRDDNNEE
jgi:hypothetical protein